MRTVYPGQAEFELLEVNVPESVPPGTQFSGSFEVRVSDIENFQSNDPDYCVTPNRLAGISTITTVNSMDGVLNSLKHCYPAPFDDGVGARNITFTGVSPDIPGGSFDVVLHIYGGTTGNEIFTQPYTVEISEGGGAAGCNSDADCAEGETCVDGVCQVQSGGGGDGRLSMGVLGWGAGVVLVLVLAVLISSTDGTIG